MRKESQKSCLPVEVPECFVARLSSSHSAAQSVSLVAHQPSFPVWVPGSGTRGTQQPWCCCASITRMQHHWGTASPGCSITGYSIAGVQHHWGTASPGCSIAGVQHHWGAASLGCSIAGVQHCWGAASPGCSITGVLASPRCWHHQGAASLGCSITRMLCPWLPRVAAALTLVHSSPFQNLTFLL